MRLNLNTFAKHYAAKCSKVTQKAQKSVKCKPFFFNPMKILSAKEKVKLAAEMYEYISGIEYMRTQVLEGFADQFKTTEDYARQLIKGQRKLKEPHSDWVIDTIWGMVTVRKLKELFFKLFGDAPEAFGYEVPTYEGLPFDKDASKAEPSKFELWQKKQLLQKEPATV